MIRDKHLLVIGGAGRNVGKTEFVCRLIRKISQSSDVYGLKVSAIFPDERLYHGDHAGEGEQQSLFEEKDWKTRKDTSRMLRAGARRVFYMRSNEEGILTEFKRFRDIVPEGKPVISESNSLGNVVQPGLAVVVRSVSGEVKPRAIKQLERADLVVVSDGVSGFSELDCIGYDEERGWYII